MDFLNFLDELQKLKIEYKVLLVDLKKLKILNKKDFSYFKKDKEEFKNFWLRYTTFFEKLIFLLKKTAFRKYFFIVDYNKLALRKIILHFYYKSILDLTENFWNHDKFIRNFLNENFKKDFYYYVNYIYKPKYIYVFNFPVTFIMFFKKYLDEKIIILLYEIDDIFIKDRLYFNYYNLYNFLGAKIYKWLFFISKNVWMFIREIRLTRRKKWLINEENLNKYLQISKAWDILLIRWNRYIKNILISWFWKHMAMYLWTWKEIKKKYKYNDLNNLDDNENYIIEATGKWVSIVNIKDFVFLNDYFAVFRTNFYQEKINRSINNALKNVWKSYDFMLNFNLDSKLICSALVLKSYAKEFEEDIWIQIQLKKIWFSITYPPNNFVREYSEWNFSLKTKINWVFFIDSIEKTWENFINSIDELKKSYKRSKIAFFLK